MLLSYSNLFIYVFRFASKQISVKGFFGLNTFLSVYLKKIMATQSWIPNSN